MAELVEIIRARRQLIRDNAPCEGCGGSLAECISERGKDPTAPPWFGCCAIGMGMAPCRHVPDRTELSQLLDEIERGQVRTAEEVAAQRQTRRERARLYAALVAPREPGESRILEVALFLGGR